MKTKIALGLLGAWLLYRVRSVHNINKRREFPVKGAVDPDSVSPEMEDRAMVDRFRDPSGNLL